MEDKKQEIMIKVVGVPSTQDRPHFNRKTGGVYYSKASTAYRKLLVAEMLKVKTKTGWKAPSKPVGLNLFAVGMRKGSDMDNLTKQVMDAAADAGLIKGDDWERVPFHLVSARKPAKGEEPHVTIFLTVLEQ